jgi:hypothetical protein
MNNYNDEVEDEYKEMREQINDGKRLPYHEYVVRRTLVYIERTATPKEIELFIAKCNDVLNRKKDSVKL